MNDNSSMEPEERISAALMRKVSTGASVDSPVSCRELLFNLTNSKNDHLNSDNNVYKIIYSPCVSHSFKATVMHLPLQKHVKFVGLTNLL